MQYPMTLNVQGAAATPWPDPLTLGAAAPQPVAPPEPLRHDRHAERRVEAPAAMRPYDSMRLQAFRRDAAETAALSTMAPSTTATASTSTAPAVTTAPTQINPLAFQPDAPFRAAPPQAPPPVQAPTAVDAQSSSRSLSR